MAETEEQDHLIELTAEIVSAYVSNNSIASAELSSLIGDVHAALHRTAAGVAEPEPEPVKPAVPVRKSITPDYIICLEDGKKFKSLKRHLRTHYDLTPEEYREKWGLPSDYPMVAPNYAKARSNLAKEMGLGQKRARA
jgi:predicted transcriptional regulator